MILLNCKLFVDVKKVFLNKGLKGGTFMKKLFLVLGELILLLAKGKLL